MKETMLLVSVYRISKTAFISLWRNRWLSLAATLMMVLTLFTISFFISLLIFTSKSTEALKDKVDLTVFFNETTSKDQIFSIQNTLLGRGDVENVSYVSKEEALARWQELNKDDENLRNIISVDSNPLPRSLEVKSTNPEDLENIYNMLSSQDYEPLVKEISYQKNKDMINNLVKITSLTKKIGWTVSIIFLLISVLIIYNTIRLTIYARSNEIEIMKLVGASDIHIQGPFFLEGVTYAILASIVSSVILYSVYAWSIPALRSYFSVDNIVGGYADIKFGLVISIQLLTSLVLGLACTLFAVKKHLR